MQQDIQELKLNDKQFLDQLTIIFGESRTGKTTAMLDIIKQVSPHISQIVVYSGTDKQNHVFDGRGDEPIPANWSALAKSDPGIAPRIMIHDQIEASHLEKIWTRQMALASVYKIANELKTLQSLFSRLQPDQATLAELDRVNETRTKFINIISSNVLLSEQEKIKQIGEVNKSSNVMITQLYKRNIARYSDQLAKCNLSRNEQLALKSRDLRPHLLLIFDDCTEQLHSMRRNPVMQKLFTQARHIHITTIINAHSDKTFDPEQKKNAFNTIFTAKESLMAYVDRGTSNLDKTQKAAALRAAKECFDNGTEHQKMLWIRDEKRFFKFTAQLHPRFCVGCDAFREYCARCAADDSSINTNNQFMAALLRQ